MTKVDIISGFLGAGKTTFIKVLISKVYGDEKTVLIENEFGEIGIDSRFMQNSGIQVTEMNSGCICCTLAGDFTKSLKQVVEQYAPERIIIEPSGVGKLSEVAKAVSAMEHEAGVEIDGLITVVDGMKAEMYMKNFGEFFNDQIKYASTVVISRTQNMTEEKIEKCIELIREKNSSASIITTPWNELSVDRIKSAVNDKSPVMAELEKLKVDIHIHEHHHHDHDKHHHHHHADEIFSSWGMETARRFDENQLRDILALMGTTTDFGEILRAKGIVQCAGEQWIEFDMVPDEMEIRECAPDYIGRICIIGTKLEEENLKKVFAL